MLGWSSLRIIWSSRFWGKRDDFLLNTIIQSMRSITVYFYAAANKSWLCPELSCWAVNWDYRWITAGKMCLQHTLLLLCFRGTRMRGVWSICLAAFFVWRDLATDCELPIQEVVQEINMASDGSKTKDPRNTMRQNDKFCGVPRIMSQFSSSRPSFSIADLIYAKS